LKRSIEIQRERIKNLEDRVKANSLQLREVSTLLNKISWGLETVTKNPSQQIAIVVTYFGEAPFWLPAFFLSCRKNPDVTWIIYGDLKIDAETPENVVLKHMTVQELAKRASDIVGKEIEVVDLRQICDFKPLYGLMFVDDLKAFDFWAYSDLDVVWGDIRRFITESVLANNDIISSRAKKLSGHFTLVRNTSRTNQLFKLIPNVEEKMAVQRYLCLDEHEITQRLKEHLTSSPSHDVIRIRWPAELTVNAAYQRRLGDSALQWRDGKTFNAEGEEVMYLHFHKLKRTMETINFGHEDSPTSFEINRLGIWR
tara:strand:+ start:8311 stop:9246 length:936 start_codon:yes stop_codon:yes gene_type:complete